MSDHRKFAIEFNNRVWALLEAEQRTPIETEEMIHAAHASHLHWCAAGTAVNRQRGLWLLARVYTVAGVPDRAAHYARTCAEVTESAPGEMAVFDPIYAREALARVAAMNGVPEAARMRAAVRAEAEACRPARTGVSFSRT